MSRKLSRKISLFIVIAFAITTILSVNINSAKAASTPSPTTLKVFFWGGSSLIRNIDHVVKEFEKRTAKTLNTKLDITVIPSSADYKQKMQLMVAAREEMDLVFDAGWMNLNTFAKQDVYYELDKYFNNPEYPGLKKSFTKDYLDANRFFGKLVAVPLTDAFTDIKCAFYRADLAEKYGMKSINSYDDFYKYLSLVKENEKNIKPMGLARGWTRAFSFWDEAVDPNPNVVQVYSTAGFMNGFALLSSDRKKVISIGFVGDPDSTFSSFPAPYNKAATYHYFVKMARKFYPLVDKDSIYQSESGSAFQAGKVAAVEGNISGWPTNETALKNNVPGAKLGVFIFDKRIRARQKGAVVTSFQAWNFLCIPKTSKKPDRVMKFLDWIFSSQDNNDLFSYGIKGRDWIPVGKNGYRIPTNVDTNSLYTFPKYQLTWNPNYIRINADIPTEVKKYFEYEYRMDTYTKSPIAGFTYDRTILKVEEAKISAVNSKYELPLKAGLFADPVGTLIKYHSDLKKAGLEKVRQELKRQLQAFLTQKYGK